MKINNGIVTSINLNIIQALIPTAHSKARPQILMQPKYITVHNTGNTGASAKANSDYITKLNEYKSWHFTVGKDEVYQQLPINEIGYHAGDGETGIGNTQSIGIEIAEVDGAEETAIKFIAELMKATNIQLINVVPHKRWSNKSCPRLILPHWTTFISDIEKELLKGQNMTLEQALKIFTDKGIMDTPVYWKNAVGVVKYLDELIIDTAKILKS
jgi:N-acetylmuramoyl-L-alanine amidase CwlA